MRKSMSKIKELVFCSEEEEKKTKNKEPTETF